jgi:hypothetical protein
MATTTTATPARCGHRSQYGLGCARSDGHDGSHWLTANAAEAREALVREGFFAPTPASLAASDCAGCAACDPREAAREEAVWADWA